MSDTDAVTFDLPLFTVINAQGDVVVRMPDVRPDGFAFPWRAAMSALIAEGAAFVMIETDAAESEADRHARACWYRLHAAQVGAACHGVITIEPDVAARAESRRRAATIVGAAGLRAIVVSNEAVAVQLAGVLLRTQIQSGVVVPSPVDVRAQHQ